MSTEYWPIYGYGVEVTLDMFDLQKVNKVLGLIEEEDYLLDDILAGLVSLPEAKGMLWATTADMYDDGPHYYILYPLILPWKAKEEPWKNLTPEKVKENIISLLLPVLRDDFDISTLEFNEIDDCGCC